MRSCIVFAMILFSTAAYAATLQRTIDLTKTPPSSEQVSAGVPILIEVENAIVNHSQYFIDERRHEAHVPPIVIPAKAPTPAERSRVPCSGDEKKKLDDVIKELEGAADESGVQKAVGDLQNVAKGPCAAEAQEQIARTKFSIAVDALAPNQDVDVTISRADKTWKATYTTGANGEFLTSYGFSFLPNRDREYFSYELGANDNVTDDKKYEIRRKHTNHTMNFVPTVDFTWYPGYRTSESSGNSWGVTFGLGFDFTNPVVVAGPSWTFHQNFTVAFGAAVQKQKRLNGTYTEGQRIKENLDAAALTTDGYAPNFFVSLTIRSLTNFLGTK